MVRRPLIGSRQETSTAGVSRQRPARAAPGGRLLLEPRSQRFLRAVGRLDAAAQLAPVQTAAIADDVRREFDEKWAATPLGIVGCCYLGPPYDAHTLTVDGVIIEHYRQGQSLPGPLERARELARTDKYVCIEVYGDRLVAVLPDGSVATVGGTA
jgi:hypothetical protein